VKEVELKGEAIDSMTELTGGQTERDPQRVSGLPGRCSGRVLPGGGLWLDPGLFGYISAGSPVGAVEDGRNEGDLWI